MITSITFFDGFATKKKTTTTHVTFFGGFDMKKMMATMSLPSFFILFFFFYSPFGLVH
jgi:hypothetical protein